MSKSISQAIEAGNRGLLIKNSLFLPFHMELLSIWVGKDMSMLSRPDVITDFSNPEGEVAIRTGESYTNLVFQKHKDLKKEYGKYKGHIILYITEMGADIFDEGARHYVKLSFHDDTQDVFMELIDDPFDL